MSQLSFSQTNLTNQLTGAASVTANMITGTVSVAAPAGPVAYIDIVPTTILTFSNGASISWEKGTLTFKGDMDESARIFFEYFVKSYVDCYIKDVMPHDNLKYLEWCLLHREEAK